MTKNPHDDLQRALSRYRLTTWGAEALEVRSEYDTVGTVRWGEMTISDNGVALDVEINAPVKEIE